MEKIGQGWQYTTYDLNNGRVLKKSHSTLKSYWVILKDIFWFREDPLIRTRSYVKNSKIKAQASFRILKENRIPSAWIGNPKLLNGLDYEQDKARPLHDVFADSDTASIKLIIDQFVVFNKGLLKLGIIDKSFNITKNFGLNKKGDIILMDIGELFDDPERIRKQLIGRAWDKRYVSGCLQDKEAQEYFIKKMDENFGLKS